MKIPAISSQEILRLSQKAEDNLQKRLVSVSKDLVFSIDREKIVKRADGQVYNGKAFVNGGELEEIYSIKDGKVITTLTRRSDNKQKLFAFNNKEKDRTFMHEESIKAYHDQGLNMMQAHYNAFDPLSFYEDDSFIYEKIRNKKIKEELKNMVLPKFYFLNKWI